MSPIITRPIPSYHLTSNPFNNNFNCISPTQSQLDERITIGMKGLSIAKRLEGIIAAREEAEQKQKLRFVDLNAVGILVRTWSRVNADQEPFKAVFDKEKKSFISTTIFESVEYRITVPLSHLSHLQLIPPSQSPPSSLNTHNSAQLILNLSQPPVFSHRPANSEVDLKCYDFTSKSGASASIHKLILDGKQMAEMELFVEEITQELRALENWFIPSTSSIDIWSPKNGELDMHYSSDVSSSSSHSDFDSTFDGDNSSSNFSTPELGDKWEEEDHFWMDNGYCEEEKKELNGLGLIIENDLPPFCPFTPKPRVTQIFPLASPELIKTKTSQTLGLDPRILENSFNLPDKISRSIPPLLPPLSFKSPQPKSPYSYHRSRGSHLDLSPISPRKLSHIPLL